MSRSNTRERGSEPDYFEGWRELFRRIREGKSFSGYERHCAFLNAGGERFVNVSPVSGFDLADDGRALALVDWDQDGRLDAWTSNRTSPRVRLLRNVVEPAGGWIALSLEGTRTNRDAVGAAVVVVTPTRRLARWVSAGTGFLSQSSKVVHVGLGDEEPLEVLVRWPGGAEERFGDVAAGRRYRLVEESGRAVALEPRPATALSAAGEPLAALPLEKGPRRTVLAARLDLPAIPYRKPGEGGGQATLGPAGGRPLVVNFWASWCQPCLEELTDWTAHEDELRASGADVITLGTDDLPFRMIAERRLARLGWPFRTGLALPQTMQVLDAINQTVLEAHGELSLPMTLLVDADHRLVALYHGKVAAETLLADLALSADPLAVRGAATPFPGRWLADPPAPAAELLRSRLADRGLAALAPRVGEDGASAPEAEPAAETPPSAPPEEPAGNEAP